MYFLSNIIAFMLYHEDPNGSWICNGRLLIFELKCNEIYVSKCPLLLSD